MPYELSYGIRKNSNSELLNCVNGTVDCLDFPELNKIFEPTEFIPLDLYKSALNNPKLRTDPEKTSYFISKNSCEVGETIEVEILPKNFNDEPKKYPGDYFIVRMVPIYQKIDNLKPTIILADKIDPINFTQNPTQKYKIQCTIPGSFQIQIAFIRSSETVSALRRIMNGANSRNREFHGVYPLEKGAKERVHCDVMLNYYEDPDKICGFGKGEGEEMYCYKSMKQKKQGCEAEKPWSIEKDEMHSRLGKFRTRVKVGGLIKGYSLENVYERIVFRGDIEVKDGNSKTFNLKPHWNQGKFETFKKQKFSLVNKTYISIGDSLNLQILSHLKSDIESQQKHRCIPQHYGFLNIKPAKICLPNKEFNQTVKNDLSNTIPTKWYCPSTNTTFIHIWHGSPLHEKGAIACIDYQIYTTDVLDLMVEHKWFGSEYFLMFDASAHLCVYNPIVFYRRMGKVVEGLKKYFEKRNEVISDVGSRSKVVFKTMSYLSGRTSDIYSVVSSSVGKRLIEIAKFLLKDVDEVKVVDVWKMTEVLFDYFKLGNLHLPKKPEFVIEGVVNKIFSEV